MKREQLEVKVGQIWEDCDKRMGGRKVRVARLDEEYAYCQPIYMVFRNEIRLLKRRMYPHSTGWKLIEGETRAPKEG